MRHGEDVDGFVSGDVFDAVKLEEARIFIVSPDRLVAPMADVVLSADGIPRVDDSLRRSSPSGVGLFDFGLFGGRDFAEVFRRDAVRESHAGGECMEISRLRLSEEITPPQRISL